MLQKAIRRFCFALAAVVALTGCPPVDEADTDTWTAVRSASEITGTWEGSTSVKVPEMPVGQLLTMPGAPDMPFWAADMVLPPSSVNYRRKMTVNANTAIADTMDCNRYLDETVGQTMKPLVWIAIQGLIEEQMAIMRGDMPESVQVDVTASNDYTVTASGLIPSSEIDYTAGEILINQHKNKLKMFVTTPFGEQQEIILHKK